MLVICTANARARIALLALTLLAALLVSATVDTSPSGAAANDCIEQIDEIDMAPGFTSSMIADGTTIYLVVDEAVVKIDATTNTEVDRQEMGVFLSGLAVADGKLYVGTVGPDAVAVLDASTLDPITTITGLTVPVRPSVVNGLVYYPQQGATDVKIIDPATDTIVDEITSLAANGSYAIDGMIYLMGLGTTGIEVVDPVAEAVVATIPVGDIPIGMVNIGRTAWVTNAADSTVSQVDLDANTQTGAAFPVAGNPRSIVVLDGALYYSSNEDAVVQAIDPPTNALGTSLVFPGGPDAELAAMVVVDDRIYVAGSQEVHVIALCPTPDTTPSTSTPSSNPAADPSARPARAITGAVPRFTG